MSATLEPTFTIMLPVNRAPALLPFAVASVRAQTRGDFELMIICDGAPAETVDCAQALAAEDPRLSVRVHEKGANRGEIWRHMALCDARGRFVCQLGDDDLWLPNHLAEVERLLAVADFGNMLHVEMRPGGEVVTIAADLANPELRQAMLDGMTNLAGPTCSAYRLAAYRSLPEGWTPAPPDIWSDLFMWRKFLRQPGLTFATRFAISAVCLPAALRWGWSLEKRQEETRLYAARVQDPAWRCDYINDALRQAADNFNQRLQQARQLLEQDSGRQRAAEADMALRLSQQTAQLHYVQAELNKLAQERGALLRRARQAEARVAFVERSRVWRLRQRLARLLGRS